MSTRISQSSPADGARAGTPNGGDLLADALIAAGVEVVFGLPGVQLDAAFDALARRADLIRVYQVRHEQATSYMADGYSRVSGRPGCCLVVPGPGLLNAMAGLATAYACNSPVICVAGQIPSGSIDAGRGLLHEIPDQLGMVRSVVKWAGRAMSPDEIPVLVREAAHQALTGRQRPVAVEVPPDVLEAEVEAEAASLPAQEESPADLSPLERAAPLLVAGSRPLIVCGGGVLQSGAWPELRQVAERLGAPVLMTGNGKGALSARHPLAFDVLASRQLMSRADVILAVGTRFARPSGGRWRMDPGQSLIRIDADPDELARDVQPLVAIAADARVALRRLIELLPAARKPATGWSGLDEIRAEAASRAASLQPQAAFGTAIREELPDDAIVVNGMTQVGYWNRIGFPVYEPRTFVTAGYQGTLGFELPTGLGAQVARPDRRVVIVAGDGGFMYNVQELATAAQFGINAISVVFDDGGYGNVRRLQRQRFGRVFASDLRNPDFVRLAEAFGVDGQRADGPEGLRNALRRALKTDRPALIVVPVGDMDDPWPMLMEAGSI
jgi:acetolactate synthase-1/2/3 large subunit